MLSKLRIALVFSRRLPRLGIRLNWDRQLEYWIRAVKHVCTFLRGDEHLSHVLRNDGLGQFPQEELEHARHRHDVAGVSQVGVAISVKRRLDPLDHPRVPVDAEYSLVVQT